MKRDFDLIREILLKIEEKESATGWIDLYIEGYTQEQISYHVKLLAEADFLDARDASTHDGICWKPISLTWQGHDFLDAARDAKIWKKAKSTLTSKIQSFTFEVLKGLLVEYSKQAIGINS
jgi:hypothetical protein